MSWVVFHTWSQSLLRLSTPGFRWSILISDAEISYLRKAEGHPNNCNIILSIYAKRFFTDLCGVGGGGGGRTDQFHYKMKSKTIWREVIDLFNKTHHHSQTASFG